MTVKLVVVKPFPGFNRGDVITDEAKISAVMTAGHAQSVVRVMAGG